MSGAPDRVVPEVTADWHLEVPGALPAGAAVRSSAVVVLPPEPQNVRVARRWVAERLPAWAKELTDTLVLLTSELVTNVVVHARTELVLGMTTTDTDVLIGVRDLDLGRRELAGPERHGGRGLTLVRDLSADMGQVRHPGGGKTYWFRVTA